MGADPPELKELNIPSRLVRSHFIYSKLICVNVYNVNSKNKLLLIKQTYTLHWAIKTCKKY